MDLTISDYPHLKSEARNRIFKPIMKDADTREKKALTTDELASKLGF